MSKYNILTTILLSIHSITFAASVSFSFGLKDNNLSSITKTDAFTGLTLTLSNPKCDSTSLNFKVDNDGIMLEPPNGVIGGITVDNGCDSGGGSSDNFSLAFNKDVTLQSYSIGYDQDVNTASFNLTQGSNSSNNTSISTGTYAFNTPFILTNNITANLLASFTSVQGGYSIKTIQLKTITVNYTPEEEPEEVSRKGNARILPDKLNITINFKGEGTVNLDSKICKNEECTYTLKSAKRYYLKTYPAAGYEFSHWSGNRDCNNNNIYLIGTTVCTANFKETNPTTNPDNSTQTGSTGDSGTNNDSVSSGIFRINTRADIYADKVESIAGFTIKGDGNHSIMFRGFSDNVDTIITVLEFPSQKIVASNDNWQDDIRADEVPQHLKLPNESDSGALVDLPAGNYTIAINSHDKIGRGGIVMDLLSKTAKITRFNTIASTGHADQIGFIIRGDQNQKVLIRGMEHTNFDPTIKLEKQIGRILLDSNENWEDAVGIPKPLPKTKDAGLMLELEPTAYIATVSDSNDNKNGKAVFSIMIREK